MKRTLQTLCSAGLLLLFAVPCESQTFNPVTVNGFNTDVVAENSPAINFTDDILDGSNYVLYSVDYGNIYSTGTGLPNNGAVMNGSRSYQLAGYDQPNCMKLHSSTALTDSFELVTPASYASVSLLAFATEGSGSVNVTLKFTDGSTITSNGLPVSDWFFNSNPVISGFDRTGRTTDSPDYQFSEPRMYPIDIAVPCADQSKQLQRIIITSTAPSNVRVCIFAVSATEVINVSVTNFQDATCNGADNGQATALAIGGVGSYNYLWSTAPAQNGATVFGLAPGSYTVTATDADGCSATSNSFTISEPAVITGSQSVTICEGSELVVGNHTYTLAGTYTDTLHTPLGCDSILTTDLSLIPSPSVNAGTDLLICSGETINLSGSGAQSYTWNNGISDGTDFIPTASDTFIVTGTAANGCTDIDSVIVTVTSVDAQISVSGITLTASPVDANYIWISCADGQALSASGDTFTPTENGDYAVVVTDIFSGCSDTSACVSVSTVGLEALYTESVTIYPNPAQALIHFSGLSGNETIRFSDMTGKSLEISVNNASADISTLDAGVYFVSVRSASGRETIIRLVKD